MRWEIPAKVDVDQLVTGLQRELDLRVGASSRYVATYFDTFDGRLWRARCVLALERADRETLLRLRPLPDRGGALPSEPAGSSPEPESPGAVPHELLEPVSRAVAFRAVRNAGPSRPRRGRRLAPRELRWWREPHDPREAWNRRLADARGLLASELPAGELRSRLERQLSIRALIPLLEVRAVEVVLCPADDLAEAGLCFRVVRNRLSDGGRLRPTAAELYVEHAPGASVDGPAEPDVRVTAWLARRGLRVTAREPLERWLGRLGRPVVCEPAVDKSPLDPGQRADVAVRTILARLCDAILVHVPGTLAQLDSEFLHDMRVAIRRSRSVLGRMRHVLPARSRARYRRELRWLGTRSGPARDLDVYLLGLPSLAAQFEGSLGPGFDVLRQWLEARQAKEYRRLISALCSSRGRRLLGDWERFVHRSPARRPLASRARAPIAAVARREIRRAWRQAMRQGKRIVETSPAADLHELRKTCKKLRYLLELFGRTVDPVLVEALMAPLKALQKVLGEIQDLEVQSALVADMARRPPGKGADRVAALEALEALEQQLADRKQIARTAFAPAFSTIADPSVVWTVRSALRASGARPRSRGR